MMNAILYCFRSGFASLVFCFLLAGSGWHAVGQGYHVDTHQFLGQNPGNLNQDLEFAPTTPFSPTGWTEVYRYAQNTPASLSGMSRGLPLPAGFAFRFNGQPVTAVRAFSGAFITFDTVQTSITFINNYLPNPQAPQRFAWLSTLFASNATAQSRILTKTFGTAPHRQFWVQWNNETQANSNGSTGPISAYGAIVLEETTNRIHLVVQRMFWWRLMRGDLHLGVQLNGTTAWVTDSVMPTTIYQNDPRPTDNLTFTFEPGARQPFDLAIGAVRVPAALPSPAAPPTPIRGMVANHGTQPLTGWRVAYQIGSSAVQQLAPATRPLAPGDTAQFTFPSGWARPAPGAYRLRVWVTSAAAQPDANAANDTLTTVLQVATREVPRRVVAEVATSSTCPPCVMFNDSLQARIRRHPHDPVEVIEYPMNFPGVGDPYSLPDFRTRMQINMNNIRNVVISTQLAAPTMVMAGAIIADPTDRSYSPPLPLYASLVQAATLPPAPLALTGTCHIGGDTVRGSVSIDPVLALPGREYSLLLVITERTTTGNASTNGQTIFHDVAKKFLLNRQLTAPLVAGQLLTIPYQHVFAAGHTVEHMDSLEVVAFVQHAMPMASSAPAAVVQAVRLRPGAALGQSTAAAPLVLSELYLAPNPASGATSVRFTLPVPERVSIEVLDALGRRVGLVPTALLTAGSHSLPLNLEGARPGLYSVRLTAGSATRVRRLVVQ